MQTTLSAGRKPSLPLRTDREKHLIARGRELGLIVLFETIGSRQCVTFCRRYSGTMLMRYWPDVKRYLVEHSRRTGEAEIEEAVEIAGLLPLPIRRDPEPAGVELWT